MSIYLFPFNLKQNSNTSNPFMQNFANSLRNLNLRITNNENCDRQAIIDMILYHNNDTDVYILNWIEEIPNFRFGFFQSVLFILFFYMQKLRGKKFVWVYHNIVSHSTESILSKWIKLILKKRCNLFITFSQEAYDALVKEVDPKVLFFNHPINSDLLNLKIIKSANHYDILIWGAILKYKGILEFLKYLHDNKLENQYKIFIIGKCKDTQYEQAVKSLCNSSIIFQNNYVDFAELKGYIANSKYVLFPYIGESTSSSGALIDTITMNGCSIGPNKGAFKDLAIDKVCYVYNDYDSLIKLMSSNLCVYPKDINNFITNNSWESFAKSLQKELFFL